MATTGEQLGRIVLRLPRAKLQLNAEANVTFVVDDASAIVAPLEDFWVPRGTGFHMTFVLSNLYGGTVSESERQELMSELRRTLVEAELWSQLCLWPTVEERQTCTTVRGAEICLKLSCSSTTRVHRAEASTQKTKICSAGTRPPPGVSVANLKSVDFLLNIEEWPSRSTEAGVYHSRESGQTAASEDKIDSWICHIISLVDAAFRSFVSKDPVRVSRSIQRDETEMRYRLGSVAPSIFCPGYTSAMEDRMHLIPSLAKSQASILTISNSPILQDATFGPRESSIDQSQEDDLEDSNHASAPLKRALSLYLWRDAALHLRERRMIQTLAPLSHVVSDRPQGVAASDLLKEASECDQSQEAEFAYEESWPLKLSDEPASEDQSLDDLLIGDFPSIDLSELDADRISSHYSGHTSHQYLMDFPGLQDESASDIIADGGSEGLQHAVEGQNQNANEEDHVPMLEFDYSGWDDFEDFRSLDSSIGEDYALFEDCNISLEVHDEDTFDDHDLPEEDLQLDITTSPLLSLLALPYDQADSESVLRSPFSPTQTLEEPSTELLFSVSLTEDVDHDLIASSNHEGDDCCVMDEVMLDSSGNVSGQSYDEFHSESDSSPFERELEDNNDMLKS